MGAKEAAAAQEVEFLSEQNNCEPKIYYGIFTGTHPWVKSGDFGKRQANQYCFHFCR